jgi:DNA-binding beta-propeller fold protein YncE
MLGAIFLLGCFIICSALPVQAQEVSPSLTIDQILYQPQRVAISDDGRIFVSEPRRNRVRVLSATGQMIMNYMVERPLAVGLDAEGHVLVGSGTRVDAFQETGGIAYSLGIGEGEFAKSNDLAYSPHGRIYVSDSPNHQVKVYGSSGTHLFNFGSEGSNDGEFNFPTGIALNIARNEIYVADQGNYRIQIFDLNGNFLRTFGQFPYQAGGDWVFEGTFTRIQGLAIDDNDRVYVVDSYQNNVQVLTAEGEFLGFIARDDGGQQYFSLPMDVVADGNQLFVSSTANSQVRIFTIDDMTSVNESPTEQVPEAFGLAQNYPNPFNPETNIRFTMPQPGWVKLTIWDIMGRQVAQLLDSPYSAGIHEVQWNGRTLNGKQAASGLYLYNIRMMNSAGEILFNANRKMLLLK